MEASLGLWVFAALQKEGTVELSLLGLTFFS